MLPKSLRLPHTSRLTPAHSFRSPFFLLKTAPNQLSSSRFGVIISKKVDKRAVQRNHMRRLLHAFIQEHESLFPTGFDYLFIVTTLFEEQPKNLAEELGEFLSARQ